MVRVVLQERQEQVAPQDPKGLTVFRGLMGDLAPQVSLAQI